MQSDSLYTVRNQNGSMTVDTAQDTLYSDWFEDFAFRGVIDPFEPMSYIQYNGMRLVGEAGSMTVDFGAYGIDLTAYEGRAYAPLNILSDMFALTYAVPSYASPLSVRQKPEMSHMPRMRSSGSGMLRASGSCAMRIPVYLCLIHSCTMMPSRLYGH